MYGTMLGRTVKENGIMPTTIAKIGYQITLHHRFIRGIMMAALLRSDKKWKEISESYMALLY